MAHPFKPNACAFAIYAAAPDGNHTGGSSKKSRAMLPSRAIGTTGKTDQPPLEDVAGAVEAAGGAPAVDAGIAEVDSGAIAVEAAGGVIVSAGAVVAGAAIVEEAAAPLSP
jgi:hypothetical protein